MPNPRRRKKRRSCSRKPPLRKPPGGPRPAGRSDSAMASGVAPRTASTAGRRERTDMSSRGSTCAHNGPDRSYLHGCPADRTRILIFDMHLCSVLGEEDLAPRRSRLTGSQKKRIIAHQSDSKRHGRYFVFSPSARYKRNKSDFRGPQFGVYLTPPH